MADTESVRGYWQARPCGTDGDPFPEGTAEHIRWIAEARYGREPFVAKYARLEEWKDRDVLEVGIGAGSDAERSRVGGSNFQRSREGSSAPMPSSSPFRADRSTSSTPGE